MKLTPEEQEHLTAIRKSKPNNFDYSRFSNAGRDFWFLLDVVNRQEAELRSAREVIEEASRIMREFLTWWREKGKHESSAYGAPGNIFSMDEFVEKSRAYLKAHPEPEGEGKPQ